MAIDEGLRHTVFERLRETLGEDVAVALMEHIPWTAPATAEQVDRLAADVDQLRSDTDQLRGVLSAMHRTVVIATVTVILSVAAMNFAFFQAFAG
jgi:ABC-type transport system involved in cytochrome bd biosynthesis fused ATPase/permease subunit